MTRRNAAWLAVAVSVLLAGAYLLTRRRTVLAVELPAPDPAPAPVASPPPAPATSPPPAPATSPNPQGHSPVDSGVVRVVEADEAAEPPLPTWVRLSIVALALLAFFAVSLVATKQV